MRNPRPQVYTMLEESSGGRQLFSWQPSSQSTPTGLSVMSFDAILLKSSKYHYNVCFPFVFPSPSQVSLTYGFSSCCGGIGFNFAIIFRTLINCSRRIFIFFPRFSPLGWHSQREAHFPSRITGAEFAIPWALITSALFFFLFILVCEPFLS